jgi:hypothetical protein
VDKIVNYLILKDTAFLMLPAKISDQPEIGQEIPIKISPHAARSTNVVRQRSVLASRDSGHFPGKIRFDFRV